MPSTGVPARAYIAVISGADRLVPPTCTQPSWPMVSYTARPVAGSATAETSAVARVSQPVARPLWYADWAS